MQTIRIFRRAPIGQLGGIVNTIKPHKLTAQQLAEVLVQYPENRYHILH